MKAKNKILSLLLSLCLLSVSSGATISWINDTSCPANWTINPPSPNDTDVITFSGPTGLFGNSCVARANFDGTEKISVDTINKEVEIWFMGPGPDICTLIYQPVCGLQGSFGPLEAGEWTFKCTEPSIAFEITFTVSDSVIPATYYVDKDAPGPFHNGASWKWAFTNLQEALDAAVSGDIILVAEGIYKPDQGGLVILTKVIPPGDRTASFALKDGVSLIGGYAGYGQPDPDARDIETYSTVLSGDLNGDDLWGIINKDDNCYHVVSACCGVALLDGFVITGGQADGLIPYETGGGVYIDGADPMLLNCTITGNVAGFGGGISSQNDSSPSILNCKIIGNSARVLGGGLYCYSNNINLTNCVIAGNSSYQAEYLGGSAIFNLGGSLTISNCTIMDNVAPNGMAITSFSWLFPATNFLTVNNSILYNSSNEIVTSVLYNGVSSEIVTNHSDTTTVSNSDIRGGWTGNGTSNISVDPLVVALGAWSIEGQYIMGDLHLQPGSPCIDQGDNSLLPNDEGDLDLDGNTTEQLPVDHDGEDRVQGSIVDMGAYESEVAVSPEPPGPDGDETASGDITLVVPSVSPGYPPVTVEGSTSLSFYMNFQVILSLTITPTSAADGTWTAWFDPDPGVVGPGMVSVTVRIRGENVDIAQLSPGVHKVAELRVYVQPAP